MKLKIQNTTFTSLCARSFKKDVLLLLFSFILALLCVQLGKVIWYDEFLHFALVPFDSFREAMQVFRDSQGLNNRQTGFYFAINYLLLNLTGASSFWLRFPSFIFGGFFFFYFIKASEFLKLSPLWVFAGLASVYYHPEFSVYIGEARPYFPFASCIMGTFCLYLIPYKDRTLSQKIIFGFIPIVFGSAMHPYFSVYWLSTFILGYIYHFMVTKNYKKSFFSISQLWFHGQSFLAILGIFIYFTVAILTWATENQKQFGYDPYFWFPKDTGLYFLMFRTHFEFVGLLKRPLFIMLICLLLVNFYRFFIKKEKNVNAFIFACLLLAFPFVMSSLLAFSSILTGFWVLPRQWIASYPFVSLAFFYLFYLESLRYKNQFIFSIFLAVFGTVCMFSATADFIKKADFKVFLSKGSQQFEVEKIPGVLDSIEWVKLANENILAGTAVHKAFKEYYKLAIPYKNCAYGKKTEKELDACLPPEL